MKKLKIPQPQKNKQYLFVKNWNSSAGYHYKTDIFKVIGHTGLRAYQKENIGSWRFDEKFFAVKRMPARKNYEPRISPKLDSSQKKSFWNHVVCEKHFVKT